MKLQIQIATCLLFVAGTARAAEAVVSVEVQTPLKSGPVSRIVVALNGKPAPGAKVEVYKEQRSAVSTQQSAKRKDNSGSPGDEGARGEIPILTLTCDEYGWLKTPKLADGQYSFVAQAGENLRADLVLDVSSPGGTMAFRMDLHSWVPERPGVGLTNPEKVPITKRLEVFRGTVTDQTGAVIPKVSIRLVRKEAGGTKVVNEIKSGSSGDFEAQLAPGTYVAIFSASGFKIYAVGFEIAPDGSRRLDVKLEVGAATQVVTVG